MADEIASLVVKITGDASDLERTIGQVERELNSLSGNMQKNTSATNSNTSANKENSSSQKENSQSQKEKTQSTEENTRKTDENTKSQQRNKKTLQETGKAWKETSESINSVAKPVQVASAALAAGGVAAVKFAMDFEDGFASVKKTVDGTPEQLESIKKAIIDMSTVGINGHNAIPMTTAELNELAAAGGQLGIETENIAKFTETMAMLGTATNLSGEAGAQTLAQFMNVANVSQEDISRLGSAIVDLGNNFATNEAKIADMAMNIGATSTQMGISAQDTLAYSTALASMGVEAQAGGSAVSRILMDIQSAVSAGGAKLNTFAKVSGKTSKEFASEWKTDASKAFQSFLKGLSKSEDIVKTLQDLGFNNIYDVQALQRFASEKGLGLLTDALERSGRAWEENIALQNEFDDKAETTASKLLVTKNNLVEAARSIGETLLPTVADASTDVAKFAQKLAGMSDESKKTLVNVAGGVIAVGAASKVTSSAIIGFGNMVEALGKLAKVAGTGSVLGKLAPTLVSISSVAGPAAIGIGVLTTATIGMYKAARAYEDYQADWARGGEEMSKSIRNQVDATRELNSLQREYRSLQDTISNPGADETTLEKSKVRIEEIKQLLSEKYNLDITVDDSELDEAIEKAKQIRYLEAKQEIPGLIDYGNKNQDDYEDAKKDVDFLNQNIEGIKKQQEATNNLKGEILLLDDALEKGNISQEQYNEAYDKLLTQAGDPRFKNMPKDILLNSDAIEIWSKDLEENLAKNEAELAENEAQMAEYRQTMQDLANAGLLEIENGEFEKGLSHITQAVTSAELSMNDWALTAALANSQLTNLSDAGDKLPQVVNDYIVAMQGFGASAQETAVGAALIKNGFTTMEQAMSAGKFDIIKQQANELAHALGLIPENKNIEFTTSGEVIETTAEKVKELDNENVHVSIDAEGNLTVLNQATGETKYLNEQGATYLQVNAEGNIDVLNEAGEKVAEIKNDPSATITVNTTVETTEEEQYDPEDKDATVKYDVNHDEVDDYTPEDKTAKVIYTAETKDAAPKAKGTQNFEGGLAVVNDERGISDPRELIVDRGRAFIPQGQNVILPLSKGAKVYTASQTQAIMRGLGIPHYASGKNNSDAFTLARDNWNHYTKTNAVTTTQELEKWLEFQEQYKDNEKDIWDIEEQIFSLQQKLYSERVRGSEKWLEHETKYNGMSTADYLAGIDRMKAYTAEYYAQGIISHEEYNDALFELDEKYLDKRKEQLDEMYDISKAYISEHTYFNDWSGDDPLSAYNRVKDRQLEALKNGELTQEEYDKYMSELGSTMLSERTEQSRNWLDEQRKYFGMSDEEYVAGLERIKAYTQQYYDEGLISRQEYNEAMTELNHSMWDEAASAYDEMLSNKQDYISDLRQQFSDEEQALRDSWTVDDRATDMADVKSQLDVYKNAVTDRGQQKYKELQEQMKQLQREEELYQLEIANNAVIEKLEAKYEQLEADKAEYLKGIAQNTNIDVSGIVGGLTADIQSTGSNITSLLSQILGAFSNLKVENTSYTDMRSFVNNISQLTPEQLQSLIESVGR